MEIESVPEEISREKYCDLVKSLGIDPLQVYFLEFHPDCIKAEVYALRDGERYVSGTRIATHRLSIPVVD